MDIDGKFGSKTEAALRSYQKTNNIKEDGIAGTETLTKLGILASVVAASSTPVAPGSRIMPEPIRRVESQRRAPKLTTPQARLERSGNETPAQRTARLDTQAGLRPTN